MKVLPGIDLAVYQGPPDDWKPQAGAISWAGIKVCELSASGPYVNPDAGTDLAFLKAAGKGRVFYTFGHPDTSPGESARFFLGEISRLGFGDQDAVALDLEVTGNRSPGQVSAWAQDVLAMLEKALDRLPVVYTFVSFADSGNCAGLGRWPLWIADPSSPAGKPRVPRPWQDWAIHQYGQTGIDRDVAAFGDLAAMRAALGRRHAVETEAGWKCDGKLSLIQIAAKNKATPSGILRRTAVHDGVFSGPMAAYLNAVFAGTLPATAPVPAGIVLRVPA